MFLLRLDPIQRTLNVKAYQREELDKAQKDYEQAEKETENDPNMQVVFVAVEDLDALRRAYPNYYIDTTGFIKAVDVEIGAGKVSPQPQQQEQQEEPKQVEMFGDAQEQPPLK
jgi:hypothetical protein